MVTQNWNNGTELVTGKLPELGGDDSLDKLSRYLSRHKTELNHILEAIYNKIGQSGNSNGWSWRKYGDGTAECWRTVECEVKCDSQWGEIYESGYYGGIDYPFSFDETPVQFLSMSSVGNGYMLGYPHGSTATTISNTGKWWFARGTTSETTDTIQVYIFARGKITT